MKLSLLESKIFGKVCYGFRRDRNKKVETVEPEAEIVQEIFAYTCQETVWRKFKSICASKAFRLHLGELCGAVMY